MITALYCSIFHHIGALHHKKWGKQSLSLARAVIRRVVATDYRSTGEGTFRSVTVSYRYSYRSATGVRNRCGRQIWAPGEGRGAASRDLEGLFTAVGAR